MKKWIYLIIAICLAAALIGCGRQGDIHDPETESTGHETTQETDTVATEETDTVATEETEETLAQATGEAELDFSDFE